MRFWVLCILGGDSFGVTILGVGFGKKFGNLHISLENAKIGITQKNVGDLMFASPHNIGVNLFHRKFADLVFRGASPVAIRAGIGASSVSFISVNKFFIWESSH